MLNRIKSLVVLSLIAVVTLLVAPGFAQTFGGDLAKSAVAPKVPESNGSSSFGTPLGIKGSNASGDLSKNAVAVKAPESKGSSSFGTPLGIKGSNASGDLAKNLTLNGK